MDSPRYLHMMFPPREKPTVIMRVVGYLAANELTMAAKSSVLPESKNVVNGKFKKIEILLFTIGKYAM